MTDLGPVVNGIRPHRQLSTVSHNIGNGVMDAIKRLSEARSTSSSQSEDSPDHCPMNKVYQVGPQISIEQVDSDDDSNHMSINSPHQQCNYDSSKSKTSADHLDRISIERAQNKSSSLPSGLTLLEGRTSSISTTSTCDTHEDSDVSDEMRVHVEPLDMDKQTDMPTGISSTLGTVSKRKLSLMESVNSEASLMDSSTDISSDEAESRKTYTNTDTVLSTLDYDDEVFHDADIDKCSDADTKLIDWACNVFSPACRMLLQHCAEDTNDKSANIQYGLKNLSNTINYFCAEQQRLSMQIKAVMLRGISSSISTDHFVKSGVEKSNTLRTHPFSGNTSSGSHLGENGGSQYDHRSYAVKVLRNVSQSLIVPLVCEAQHGFNVELYRAIVQALQKISWKVEACLSFNDPTKQVRIHDMIFCSEETSRIEDMMIGVFPPEEPSLQNVARSRSESVSGSNSRDASPRKTAGNFEPSDQRVIKRTLSGRIRPTGTVFDSASLPDEFQVDGTATSEPRAIPSTADRNPEGRSGDITPVSQSLDNTPRVTRSRTATDGDLSQTWKSRPHSRAGFLDKDGMESSPDYFRPNRARRTTVSLSKNEVTKLGLTVAKRIEEAIEMDSTTQPSAEHSSYEEDEQVREQLHSTLMKDFDQIKGDKGKVALSHFKRMKSASMSDLLDEGSNFLSPPSSAPRHSHHEGNHKGSLEIGGESCLVSPGPYKSTYSNSYISFPRQHSEGNLIDNVVSNEWVYLERNHVVDCRVARSSSVITPSPTHIVTTPTRKEKKQHRHSKNVDKPKSMNLTTSEKFKKSLLKTTQALRRASTSISKSSKTNVKTTVEATSLDMLLETPSQHETPVVSISTNELPPSPLSKARVVKSDTMPKKRIGTLFRGSKPASKSFSKGDSLARKRKSHRSGFLEGYQDISIINAFSESIDLKYSEVVDKEFDKGVQAEGDEQLLISVEVADKQSLKSAKKRLSIGASGSGSSWFELTVTTNIKQFGRSHYTILRTFKQVISLFDDLAASYVYKLPERPDKKINLRKQCQQMEDVFRCVSGNPELRVCNPFVLFLMPDDEFGSFIDSGSEISFDLLMTFYTPDVYPGPPGSHRDVDTVLPEDTPSKCTPSPAQTRKTGTLKRGTLHVVKKEGKEDTSTFVVREEDQDALIIACEEERYVVVAGTFDKLVEQLACEEKPDPRFVTTLLLGYRHFSTSADLLTGLLRRFHLELPPDATDEEIVYAEKWRYVIQLRVLDILTYWMKKCWPDFYRYQEVLDMINGFIEDLKNSEDPNFKLAGTNLEIFVKEKMESSPEFYTVATPTSSRSPSAPNTPTHPHPVATLDRQFSEQASHVPLRASQSPRRSPKHHQPVDINSLTAIQLARQLTLIELEFLKLITTHELAVSTWEVNTSANKPFRKNLDNFIARFNKVSYWVASEICSVNDAKLRGALIEKFVEIAKQCQEHKNFNTMISIVSGLSLSAVRRLKRSWEFVGERSTKTFHKLSLLTSPIRNHWNYRKVLALVHRRDACIPYFGVFIRDLTFFNDGNNKNLKNGLINFSKLRTMVLKFEELKCYQRSKYFFPPEDRTREFCRNLWSLTETDLYETSLLAEPRDPQPTCTETDV